METTPKNRGKDSGDDPLFAPEKMRERLRQGVTDMNYLMTRGYAQRSALSLVGNRYKLNVRQQKALMGMSASEAQVKARTHAGLTFEQLRGGTAVADGFNVLILLESLLSGAYIFKGSDGFYRDLSSVHGSYRKVSQTGQAIALVGDFFAASGLKSLHWFFDKPVSNSGKLKQLLTEYAAAHSYNWEISLTFATDKDIVATGETAISSDAWILDNAPHNFNLLAHLLPVAGQLANLSVIDLFTEVPI